MKRTTQLRRLIEASEILVMPGAYDAISAKMVERAGFKAIQCSGFGLAASILGMPDIGLLTMSEMVIQTRNIARAVQIPVMADGDTGFGNAINVVRTVEEFEWAGAAGINLEDQVAPKRCGHLEGKEIVSMEEMIGKIQAAVYARKDPDFVINARTDALAISGIDEGIRRANAYVEAGADMIFVEAPTRLEDIRRLPKEIKAPVSINMGAGIGARRKTPYIPLPDLQSMGYARVSIPGICLGSAMKGMAEALNVLKEIGITEAYDHLLVSFQELNKIIGLPEVKELEKRFLTQEILGKKYGAL